MSLANPFKLIHIINEIKEICDNLSNAPNDVRMLSMEIDTHIHTLTDLQRIVTQYDSDGLRQVPQDLENILNMISNTLVTARLFLSSNAKAILKNDTGSIRSALDKGRWVLKAGEVKRLKEDLQTCGRVVGSYLNRETFKQMDGLTKHIGAGSYQHHNFASATGLIDLKSIGQQQIPRTRRTSRAGTTTPESVLTRPEWQEDIDYSTSAKPSSIAEEEDFTCAIASDNSPTQVPFLEDSLFWTGITGRISDTSESATSRKHSWQRSVPSPAQSSRNQSYSISQSPVLTLEPSQYCSTDSTPQTSPSLLGISPNPTSSSTSYRSERGRKSSVDSHGSGSRYSVDIRSNLKVSAYLKPNGRCKMELSHDGGKSISVLYANNFRIYQTMSTGTKRIKPGSVEITCYGAPSLTHKFGINDDTVPRIRMTDNKSKDTGQIYIELSFPPLGSKDARIQEIYEQSSALRRPSDSNSAWRVAEGQSDHARSRSRSGSNAGVQMSLLGSSAKYFFTNEQDCLLFYAYATNRKVLFWHEGNVVAERNRKELETRSETVYVLEEMPCSVQNSMHSSTATSQNFDSSGLMRGTSDLDATALHRYIAYYTNGTKKWNFLEFDVKDFSGASLPPKDKFTVVLSFSSPTSRRLGIGNLTIKFKGGENIKNPDRNTRKAKENNGNTSRIRDEFIRTSGIRV